MLDEKDSQNQFGISDLGVVHLIVLFHRDPWIVVTWLKLDEIEIIYYLKVFSILV